MRCFRIVEERNYDRLGYFISCLFSISMLTNVFISVGKKLTGAVKVVVYLLSRTHKVKAEEHKEQPVLISYCSKSEVSQRTVDLVFISGLKIEARLH